MYCFFFIKKKSLKDLHHLILIRQSLHTSRQSRISQTSFIPISIDKALLHNIRHHLLESTVHHVLLSQNLVSLLLIILDVVLLEQALHLALVVGLPSSGHQSHLNVLGVLQPLEVGHSHTTSVGDVIRNNWDVLLIEDLLSFEGHWPIGTLAHDLAFQFMAIVLGEASLNGAWQ